MGKHSWVGPPAPAPAPTTPLLMEGREGLTGVTWGISFGSSIPPGRQGAMEEELPLRPLSNLMGRDGVTEVLPPGQCGAQQAQGLPRARGALQDAIHLLNGVGAGWGEQE